MKDRDIAPVARAYAESHGGKVDTNAVARSIIAGMLVPADLGATSRAVARWCGRQPGAMFLAPDLWKIGTEEAAFVPHR